MGQDKIKLIRVSDISSSSSVPWSDEIGAYSTFYLNPYRFDEKMIESLFGYNLRSSSRTEEGKSKTPSPGKHVMEHKRLQNITILMKALNANAEQVRNALMLGRSRNEYSVVAFAHPLA